jgi:hypothetical protein
MEFCKKEMWSCAIHISFLQNSMNNLLNATPSSTIINSSFKISDRTYITHKQQKHISFSFTCCHEFPCDYGQFGKIDNNKPAFVISME